MSILGKYDKIPSKPTKEYVKASSQISKIPEAISIYIHLSFIDYHCIDLFTIVFDSSRFKLNTK